MNETDIPIDIHTAKLQEWLVSRRITSKNFQPQIRAIRNKISNAIKDMPENEELVKLLSGAHINYFHCQKIIDILKQTEKDTRSLFGSYGSQRMKDWQEIVKQYEKDNIYLGEAAQILVRNLNYEIPSIKKQMAKFEQQSEDALKRIQDLNKTEHILLNEHSVLCQQLGIKGEHLKRELTEKVKELPKIYSSSIENIRSIKDALDMYSDFTDSKICLPIVRHVIENGNTTVYQYLTKEAPLQIEESTIELNIADGKQSTSETDNEIDFGGDDTTNGSTSAEIIDFGDLNSDIQLETGDIDWGETMESVPTSEEVDFDVPLEEYGIVVEGVGMDGGTAKGDQALTILDSPQYHDKFVDELYELQSFIKLRLYELNYLDSSSNVMFSLMDSFSTYDSKSVAKMLTNIDSIIANVSSEQTRHLFQLKHSPKYADLLAGKLNQKLNAVDKIRATKEILKLKSVEFNEQKLALKPILDDTIAQIKVLQQQIERDISKRYKNRVVNLMGGVSFL